MRDQLQPLLRPFETQLAMIFSIRTQSPQQVATLRHTLSLTDYPSITLQPPTPWEPLAPLRHLCEHFGHALPRVESSETSLCSWWLGPHVHLSRYFMRTMETLRGQPTFVWIEQDDLHQPLWGDFLQLVRQHQVRLPLSFLYVMTEHDASHVGVKPFSLQDIDPTKAQEAQPALQLPKRTKQYLAQATFFGERYHRDIMTYMSRADHKHHKQLLRQSRLLDKRGRFERQHLRSLQLDLPPQSKHWRTRAHKKLKKNDQYTQKDLWLRFSQAPHLVADKEYSAHDIATGLWSLGTPFMSTLSSLFEESTLTDEASWLLYMAMARTPQHAPPAEISLSSPYKELAEIKYVTHPKNVWPNKLNQLHTQLKEQGPSWAAALAATELVSWYLCISRPQFAFKLLKPYQDEAHWALQWQMNILYAQTYLQLKRRDLAHNHLERAVKCAPKPLSPILQADIRMLTAQLLAQDGQGDTASTQMKLARDVYRAAGDGPRLAHYLMRNAERIWAREQFDEARNLFGQCFDLFRTYNDNLGIHEAQLKLGLVINHASHDTLQQNK